MGIVKGSLEGHLEGAGVGFAGARASAGGNASKASSDRGKEQHDGGSNHYPDRVSKLDVAPVVVDVVLDGAEDDKVEDHGGEGEEEDAGTFLIFSAMVLLIVASISAPTVSKINFLSIPLTNGSSVNYGTLGYCIQNPDGNVCSPSGVGYKIGDEVNDLNLGSNTFGTAKTASLHGATEGLILHQIGAGIAAIAFLLAVCSHRLGYLIASAVAFLRLPLLPRRHDPRLCHLRLHQGPRPQQRGPRQVWKRDLDSGCCHHRAVLCLDRYLLCLRYRPQTHALQQSPHRHLLNDPLTTL